MLLTPAARLQPSYDRWLGSHPFGHLGLGQSGLFPGAEQLIEQGKPLLQVVILADKIRVFHPFLDHFIVCLYRDHLSPCLFTSANRFRAIASSFTGVFCDFLTNACTCAPTSQPRRRQVMGRN